MNSWLIPPDPNFGFCDHCGNPIEDEDREDSIFCSSNCEFLNAMY